MNKKIYWLVIVLVLVVAVIAAVVYFSSGKKTATQAPVTTKYPATLTQAIEQPEERVTDSLVKLDVQKDFLISYAGDLQDGTFIITVDGEPLLEVAKQAEQAFLQKYQLQPDEACRLNVVLNVPSVLDSNLAGYDFGMSFCPYRPHLEDVRRQTNWVAPYSEELPQ